MNRISPLLMLCFLLSFTAYAQKAIEQQKPTEQGQPITKSTYLAIGTGINNNTGILGFQLEQKVASKASIYAGAGLGSWGYKLSVGGRYYFKQHPFGSALGLSYSRATGVNDVPLNMEVVNSSNGIKSNMDIKTDYKPVSLINLSYLKYWKMGRTSRFNLEVGYSILLNSGTDNYSAAVPPGYELSTQSKNVIKVIQPGGILIAIGFSFGL